MLTRNFDNYMAAYITGYRYNYRFGSTVDYSEEARVNGQSLCYKISTGAIYVPGNEVAVNHYGLFTSDSNLDKGVTLNSQYTSLLVGSNNAEETYDDYKLDLITTLTASNCICSNATFENGNFIYRKSKIFTNNTDADITINEAGLFCRVTGYPEGSSSEYSCYLLLYRKKFDEPIVVPANGGVTNIVLDITIPLHTNAPTE